MFKKLFGGRPAEPRSGPSVGSKVANQTISSLEELTEREAQLEKRKMLVEKRIEDETEKAKAFTKQKKKTQALMCLKKKKMYEQEVVNVENLIIRLSEQRIMLENQKTMVDVVSTMKNAAQAQKATMKDMNVDNVDEVLEAINEQTDEYKAVQDALAQPAGIAGDLDDDDLLAELEELEQEELDKELLEPAPVPSTPDVLPSVPTAAAKKPAKTPEELELEALEAEMAM
ncbi:hypothetical protein BSKO_09004 [Bryopsis sp. KO-2023]|nr:hypothetical protein BSKO_09004 [Bryopsis sp. KO-2023]